MVDKELINYIHETAGSGFSHDQIRHTLADAGWLPQEIDDAFASIAEPKGIIPPAHKVTLPQNRGFFARHLKSLIVISALIICLPLAAYGAVWGYQKFFNSESAAALGDAASAEPNSPPAPTTAEKAKRDNQRLEDVAALQSALDTYFQANQIYPKDLATLLAAGYLTAIPRDPKTGDTYLYSPLNDPAIHYSLSFVLEGSVGSLAPGLQQVSSETKLSADFAKREESAIRGQSTALSDTLVITNLASVPFYPAEEVTLDVMPLPGVEFVDAFFIIDSMKLVDRRAPFGFSFSAPRRAGEYPVQVFAFDAAGNGYTQTTRLTVKER